MSAFHTAVARVQAAAHRIRATRTGGRWAVTTEPAVAPLAARCPACDRRMRIAVDRIDGRLRRHRGPDGAPCPCRALVRDAVAVEALTLAELASACRMRAQTRRALLASLEASYDGWALSTSAAALQELLPLCPPGVRVCAWTKPGGVPPGTRGPHNTWEVVLLKPARRERPGVRDSLVCHPARGGGSLPGRKPIAFVRWVVQLLGARRGDTLDDLYPGTGVVGRVWAEVSAGPGDDTSGGTDDDGGPS